MELEEYPYQLESDDKRIYVGTRNEILMINQETYIIEKEIEKCSSFHLLIQLNENVLLCEGKKHILFIWDIKKEEKRIISFEIIEKIANNCGYKIYFENEKEKFQVKDITRKVE